MRCTKLLCTKKAAIFLFCLPLLLFLFFPRASVNAKELKLNKTSAILEVGKTTQLTLTTGKNAKWTSKNSVIANVSNTGLVTAKKPGATTITAEYNGKKYTCKLQIYKVDTGNKEVDKKMKSIIKSEIKPAMATLDKIKAIHDWIVLNCKYDIANYNSGTIPEESYSIEGVILNGTAVCSGYSETFLKFMNSLGIACKEVVGTGNGGSHAWNIVKVNGVWSWIDVTWDDPVPDVENQVLYNYFLLSDKELKKDHAWTAKDLPKCDTSQNQYTSQIVDICKTEKDFISLMYKAYKSGKDSIITYVPDSLITTIKDDFYDIIRVFDQTYHLSFSSYSMRYYNFMDNIMKLEYTFVIK